MNTYKYLLVSVLSCLVLLSLARGEPGPVDKDNDDNYEGETNEYASSGEDTAYYETCADGYEGPDCATSLNKCEQDKPCLNNGTCIINETNNYSCVCAEGFGGKYCENVNECRYSVACDLPSANDAANCYTCRNGFIKDPADNMRCKYANETLLIVASLEKGIELVTLDGKKIRQIGKLKDGKDNFVAMAYSFQANTLFWSSQQFRVITADQINAGSAIDEFTKEKEKDRITELAVDWIYNHLYYKVKGQLAVSNFNGTMKKILIKGFGGTKISLDPLNARMYWEHSGNERVEADLDGSRQRVIVSPTKPDHQSGSEFDFVNYQTIRATSGQLVDKYIYRTKLPSDKIVYKINKGDPNEKTEIYKCKCVEISHISVFNEARQPRGENLCSSSQCSHFCIPVRSQDNGPASPKCYCPDQLSLSDDQQNCL